MKKKLFLIFLFLIFSKENFSRSVGETEIFTDEGIEVFQNEKFYLLKKNVRIVADDFKLTGDEVKIYFEKDLYDIVNIQAKGNVDLHVSAASASVVSKDYGGTCDSSQGECDDAPSPGEEEPWESALHVPCPLRCGRQKRTPPTNPQ